MIPVEPEQANFLVCHRNFKFLKGKTSSRMWQNNLIFSFFFSFLNGGPETIKSDFFFFFFLRFVLITSQFKTLSFVVILPAITSDITF